MLLYLVNRKVELKKKNKSVIIKILLDLLNLLKYLVNMLCKNRKACKRYNKLNGITNQVFDWKILNVYDWIYDCSYNYNWSYNKTIINGMLNKE